jgi:hypothetical protein
MTRFPEERMAELLRLLRPVPTGWVEAAQELAPARADLDRLVARAEADARFRELLIADLNAALAQEGIEPSSQLADAIRKRFSLPS